MADAAGVSGNDWDAERKRLLDLWQAQLQSLGSNQLQPASLKGLDWLKAQRAHFVADAGVVIVEFEENAAVVISGNTQQAVQAVAARGMLQMMKVKHVVSKIMTPLGADWDAMIRSVVNVTEGSQAEAVIQLLTGNNMSLEDFGVTDASVWQRDVLIIEELTTACRRPLLDEKVVFTSEQFAVIGSICAASLFFNTAGLLAHQVGLAGENEEVTAMNQTLHAEPDGRERTAFMGKLGEFLESLFTQNKQDEAAEDMSEIFFSGSDICGPQQMTQLMHWTREGFKTIASLPWEKTKENLTKLVNKSFRNVKNDVGKDKLDETLEFLKEVHEEIGDIVEGRQEIVGMCGVKSIVSIATDF